MDFPGIVEGFIAIMVMGLIPGVAACFCAHRCKTSESWVLLSVISIGITAAIELLFLHNRSYDFGRYFRAVLRSPIFHLIISIPAFLGLLSIFVRKATRHKRLGPEHCRTCGYLLTGLTEPRCPECSTMFELPLTKTSRE